MQAGPRTIQTLLQSPDQFIIPLFQRTYAWQRKDWQRLWSDLLALLEPAAPSEHFMGALVCMPTNHEPGKAPQYLVIDGQQRLMTLYLVLCALRDVAGNHGVEDLAAEIGDYFIVHRHGKNLNRYKILPRLRDRQTLFDIADLRAPVTPTDNVGHAYHFFTSQIASQASTNGGGDATGQMLRTLYSAAISRLTLVMITLEEENAFQIFETLNSTGQPLDQADLIRNHVFMHVPLQDQDSFDDHFWRPLEDSLTNATPASIALRDFYRDFLMQRGTYVRPDGVYSAFREYFASIAVPPKSLAANLRRCADAYIWLNNPKRAPSPSLRRELDRLRRLGVSTANPLLLRLLDFYLRGATDAEVTGRCLRVVQSFVIRRAVTRESTRGYGVLFAAAAREIEEDNALESLTDYLAARGWPGDSLFVHQLVTFPLYRRAPNVARVLLMALEESANHREQVDVGAMLDSQQIQLEHVMPQSIGGDDGASWRMALGPDFEMEHSRWVHTLGNLTLSGYNQPLSNHPFNEKRKLFEGSHLELNRYFATTELWNQASVHKRGTALAERVAELWPAPSVVATVDGADTRPSGAAAPPATGEVRRNSWRNYPTIAWTKADIRRLKADVHNPTVRATMDLTSADPGQWVSLRQIEARAGRTLSQARSDLAGLTMIVKSRFGRRNWPFEALWAAGGEQQYYYRSLSDDHARWWR